MGKRATHTEAVCLHIRGDAKIFVDRNSPLPLYLQVKQDLVNKITSGHYAIHDMIPGQKTLADMYGISEITVRKALDILVSEGYLHRLQGKGTFVAERKINRMLNLMSFTEEMRSKGLNSEAIVLELEIVKDKNIARKLKISPLKEIVKIERLRLIDGKPHALQSSFIPQSMVPLEELRVVRERHSLYEVLEGIGIKPRKAHEIYRADVLKEKRLCQLLDAEPGEPILVVERSTYTNNDVLFEYVFSILKGDIYTVEVVLNG